MSMESEAACHLAVYINGLREEEKNSEKVNTFRFSLNVNTGCAFFSLFEIFRIEFGEICEKNKFQCIPLAY